MSEKKQWMIQCMQEAAAYFDDPRLSQSRYRMYRRHQDPHLPGVRTICQLFGDWKTAIDQANLQMGSTRQIRCDRCGSRFYRYTETHNYCTKCAEQATHNQVVSPHAKKYKKEEIIQALQEAAKHCSTYLSVVNYTTIAKLHRDHHFPTSTTIYNYFQSWPNALQAAGLDHQNANRNSVPRTYTDEELIDWLRKANQLTPGKLTTSQYKKFTSKPSVTLIRSRFGSWEHALEQAEILSSLK